MLSWGEMWSFPLLLVVGRSGRPLVAVSLDACCTALAQPLPHTTRTQMQTVCNSLALVVVVEVHGQGKQGLHRSSRPITCLPRATPRGAGAGGYPEPVSAPPPPFLHPLPPDGTRNHQLREPAREVSGWLAGGMRHSQAHSHATRTKVTRLLTAIGDVFIWVDAVKAAASRAVRAVGALAVHAPGEETGTPTWASVATAACACSEGPS